ncbi:MAG: FMN-binding negative transcriptional regulator [Aliishimia sp.]
MHPNPVYRTKGENENLDYAAKRAFGTLAMNGEDHPLLAHIPFVIEGEHVWFHLVRSNRIVRALTTPLAASIAVLGPDSYISPDWYGAEDQVPTWNYIAVHLRGTVELRPQSELHDLLNRQSAFFERQLTQKTPWTPDKMSEGVMERMMRSIVPCRMALERVDGTWKLNQNKPDVVRLRAADNVAESGIGTEVRALADQMRNP